MVCLLHVNPLGRRGRLCDSLDPNRLGPHGQCFAIARSSNCVPDPMACLGHAKAIGLRDPVLCLEYPNRSCLPGQALANGWQSLHKTDAKPKHRERLAEWSPTSCRGVVKAKQRRRQRPCCGAGYNGGAVGVSWHSPSRLEPLLPRRRVVLWWPRCRLGSSLLTRSCG